MFAASKSGSVDAKDPQFNYVTMLLHGDGTNGSQNNTFVDSSTNNFTITRNGNTTQGTFTPYGSNWSTSFNGSSDYLTTPQTTSLNIGTGTFTVEAFVYLNSKYSSGGTSIINLGNGANGGGPFTGWGLIIDFDAGGSTAYPAWYRFDGSITQYTSSTSLNVAQWYHLAVARDSSNNIAIWVNGTRVFSGTSTVTYNNVNSDPLNIGRRTNGSANSPNWMNGYISNGRVVIGSNVYDPTQTTITVPTTPLTAVTNTQLLVLQSNRFVDNSSASRTMTVAGGSPSVQRFSPFAPLTVYNPATNGGSGYFDGSGDYLTLSPTSAFAFGTGDFTVESWIYPTATPATGYIIDARNSGQTSTWSLAFGYSGTSNRLEWGFNGSTIVTGNTTSVIQSQWNHIAYTRSGTTGSLYVNGTRIGTATDSNNYSTAPNTSYIATKFSAGSGDFLTGYFGDTRTVKGTAVYTGTSYTVPTAPLTAITNTSLLLNYTNAGILDNAMMNDLETVGNAQISTSVKKYGTGSLAFDGTGDGLVVPDNVLADFGSGNFTIEFWLYLNSVSGEQFIYAQTTDSNPYTSPVRIQLNGSQLQAFFSTSQGSWATQLQAGAANSTATWYQFAIVRNGTSVVIYRNGTSYDSGTLTGTLYNSSEPVRIGYTIIGGSSYASVNGYIDDLRITKGVARYTANFTAPTTAFADKG